MSDLPNYFVGAHVSASGGVENAPLNAAELGANAFALFTKNQRRWDAKPLTKGNITKFRSEEHTSELQSHHDLVCRLLLEKKKKT